MGKYIVLHERDLAVRRLSEATITKRVSVLRNAQTAIGHPLIEATTDELRTWLSRPLGPSTVRAYVVHLGQFFGWCVDEGHRADDPTRRIVKPRRRKYLPRPVDSAGLRSAIEQADPRMRVMLTLAARCGMRCAEIAGLDAEDIHDGEILVRGKGDKERIVPLHPVVAKAIDAYRPHARGALLLRDDGHRLTPWNVSHMGREHLHACGVHASMHQLRHRYATDVYAACHDLGVVGELLGHASMDTTRVYAQLERARLKQVVMTLAA